MPNLLRIEWIRSNEIEIRKIASTPYPEIEVKIARVGDGANWYGGSSLWIKFDGYMPIGATTRDGSIYIDISIQATYYLVNVTGSGAPPSSFDESARVSDNFLLTAPMIAPDAPTITGVSRAGDGRVSVSFSLPPRDGNTPITGYTVTSSGGQTATGTASPILVSGLTNGTAYTFTTKATNAVGNSVNSNTSSSIIVGREPDAPTITNVTAGTAQATIAFSPPSNNGGFAITSYKVTSSNGQIVTGTSSPLTITNIVYGTYTFTVQAINNIGTSIASTPSNSTTVLTVPAAPAVTSVVDGNQQVTVSFTPPTNNGGTVITNYTVTSSGGQTATATSSPIIVTGLTNGTAYTFTVKANNAQGSSASSNVSASATPATVPSAPIVSSVLRNANLIVVRFTANNNGAAITSYNLVLSDGQTLTSSSSPIYINNVQDETIYTFTLTATNRVGTSAITNGRATKRSHYMRIVEFKDWIGAHAPRALLEQISIVDTTNEFNIVKVGDEQNWGLYGNDYARKTNFADLPYTYESVDRLLINLNESGTYYVAEVNQPAWGASSTAVIKRISDDFVYNVVSTAPQPPTITTVTRGNAQVSVAFTPPSNYGGSPITGYTVTSSGGQTVTGTSSPIIVTGLTNGTAYTFTVKATNVVGDSPASAPSSSVTPVTTPSAPSISSVTRGNTQVAVAFTIPASNGGSVITSYRVTSSGGQTVTGTSSPLTVTGLTNGTAYTFTVKATNAIGDSSSSTISSSVTPGTVPGAPTISSITRGDTQVAVAFTGPVNNGGYAITGYTVTSSGGQTATGTSSPLMVTGLTNGTAYTFTVKATNAIGDSSSSTVSSSVTPGTVPGAPTISTVTRGNSQVAVAFTAPANNGGYAITGYTVTSSGGQTVTGTSSPLTVTGLTNGTSYTFTVKATNTIGDSSSSTVSSSIIPGAAPSAPSITGLTRGNGQISVVFTAPANNGGLPITSYRVTSSGGQTATGSSSPITITGLTSSISYTFTVTATNDAGTSAASAPSSSIYPATPPDAPSITSVTRGNSQIVVAFTAPANNGGSPITGYTVTSSGGQTVTGISSPLTVTGLTNGTSYTFTVVATNAIGSSSASAASSAVIPATTPATPTAVVATRGNGQATVSFTPGSTGGLSVSYTVKSNPGNKTATGSASGITVGTLTNGTSYTFTVVATNDVGSSAPSTASLAVVPATVPGAPTITGVAMGDKQAMITFSAPASNGGSPITVYTITSTPGNITAIGTTNPIIITGLTNNTDYSFIITATNEIGTSVDSTAFAAAAYASTADLTHTPVEINFEVELDAASALNIFGDQFVAPTNIVLAEETLPVNALYDATTNTGLIEIWEPKADPNNIYCQLANTDSSSVGGPNLANAYKETLKLLARGLQKVLCNKFDCSQVVPFNDSKYASEEVYRVQRDFGRLGLAIFAHYFFGHVDATIVINNDTQYVMNMLSLNNTADGQAAARDETAQGPANRYAQFSTAVKNEIDTVPITSWTNQTGSISDANLARRLTAAVVTKGLIGTTLKTSKVNDPAIPVEEDKKKELAWIVRQVVGQDATRLMNEDNTERTKNIHQLLRFYPGDIIYMNIVINMPTVIVGQGQHSGINQTTLQNSYAENKNYTLKIVLAERDAAL